MSKPGVEVQTGAVAATSSGYAIFLGNEGKAFAMFVDHSVGAVIAMFMQGTQSVGEGGPMFSGCAVRSPCEHLQSK